jgi:hypothetical protein
MLYVYTDWYNVQCVATTYKLFDKILMYNDYIKTITTILLLLTTNTMLLYMVLQLVVPWWFTYRPLHIPSEDGTIADPLPEN